MTKKEKQEQPEINLLITRQNMDTPYITDQEVDSDQNEDPKREFLLDASVEAYMEQNADELKGLHRS